ncbi:hypothetical protein [Pseudarthrobacter sp. S6]|uniref:phage tail tube protein n=1 Tax=Pseudarthrobacter sp. S6 TaxID=3418420 RepID=UPI003CF85D2B
MALETAPLSVNSDGNLLVSFVPTGNPLSVANLIAAGTKAITYSLTPGGFNRATTQDTVSDERLTMLQLLEQAGRVKETLEVEYVFGDAGDVAGAALTKDTAGWIVVRYAIPNATAWTIGQKVDVIPIKCGIQAKSAPTANGVFTKKQKLFVTGAVQTDAVLIT